MRLVEVTVPPGMEVEVRELLEDNGIDYRLTDEISDQEYVSVISFPLPTTAVEPILDELQAAGIPEEAFTIVVGVETVQSKEFTELQEEHATESVAGQRISRQELHTEAEELTPAFGIFLAMTMISAGVATAGLLLDSPAIVVGSMVIAPLIGPALAASVGTVIDDHELFAKGVRYQLMGVGAAILGSTVLAWLLQTFLVVPPGVEIADIDELHARMAPDLLSLPVAIGAGIAGVLSLSTGISVALVGVMIAAALIPPAASVGIALAWGLPTAAMGSLVLVLVNLLSVNLTGLLTLWYLGYRPGAWFEDVVIERRVASQVVVLIVVTLLLSAFLVGVTYTNVELAAIEEMATEESEAVLAEYEEHELLGVEVELLGDELPFEQGMTLDATETIDVIMIEVSVPPDTTPNPVLSEALQDRITEELDADVTIRIEYTYTTEM